jgi:hypothetical protein
VKSGQAGAVYDSSFGGFTSDQWGTATTAALEAKNAGNSDDATFTFTVSLDANADKTSQGKTASASFDFLTTQLQGESFTSGLFE